MFKQFPVHQLFLSVIKICGVFWVKPAEMVHEFPWAQKEENATLEQFIIYEFLCPSLSFWTLQGRSLIQSFLVRLKRKEPKWGNLTCSSYWGSHAFCMRFLCACFFLDVTRTDHTFDPKTGYSFSALFYLTPRKQCWWPKGFWFFSFFLSHWDFNQMLLCTCRCKGYMSGSSLNVISPFDFPISQLLISLPSGSGVILKHWRAR